MSGKRFSTAYAIPFRVTYAGADAWASGTALQIAVRYTGVPNETFQAVAPVRLLTQLAATGALAGNSIRPSTSSLRLSEHDILAARRHIALMLRDCVVDPCSIVVLTHLFLAADSAVLPEEISIFPPTGETALHSLSDQTSEFSTYPERYAALPFRLIDEQPESGGYTFTADLASNVTPEAALSLGRDLSVWTAAVKAGAYGLAPIPPQQSYAEPAQEAPACFDTTIEWSVSKVRADPACIDALVNIFAAFHDRWHSIKELTIS